MAFNANIPQATDQISQSQGQLLQNFQALQTLIDVNHVDFASADQGKHMFVTMPNQGADPATGATEINLYNKVSAYLTTQQLYLNNPSTGVPYEFTSILSASPGWTFLPSGALLKWGTGSGTGPTTITFPVGAQYPVFTQVLSCQLTTFFSGTQTDSFVQLSSFNTTGISVYCTQRTTNANANANFQYLVIGNV